MSDRKIRIVVVDGLTAEDVLKLKAGGFFDGAPLTLPAGATGQEATMRVPDAAPVTPPAPVPVLVPAPVVATPQAPLPVVPVPAPMPAVLTPEEQETRRAVVETVVANAAAAGLDLHPLPDPLLPTPATAAPAATRVITPGQLASAVKLRDLLQLLLDSGMPACELATYLESVREEVPLLGRIPNIADRVSRTLTVMGVEV